MTAENGRQRYEYMFDIKTPRRIYFLAVESHQEMTNWVRMICQACGLTSAKEDDENGKYTMLDILETNWLFLGVRQVPKNNLTACFLFLVAYSVVDASGDISMSTNEDTTSNRVSNFQTNSADERGKQENLAHSKNENSEANQLKVQGNTIQISSPYIHLSQCYAGKVTHAS